MQDDEIGLELLRLYRELRAATDPRSKAALRQLIDAALDRAQNLLPHGYAGVGRDQHF